MSAGFICAGDLGEIKLLSDNTWLARLDKAHKRDTALYSRQLNFQEHVDAVKDDRSCHQGIIESSWERKGNGISVRLKLPQGVKAKIIIPGHESEIEGSFECVFNE
jgi:hypothetical protein